MITFPRVVARQFHQVLRKAGLLKPVRTNLPPCLRLIAGSDGLTLRALDFQICVSLTIHEPYEPETLVVPLEFLADCSQRTEDEVTLAARNGRLQAVWTDRGMPVERDYDPIDGDQLPPAPVAPSTWSEHQPALLIALRDAMATCWTRKIHSWRSRSSPRLPAIASRGIKSVPQFWKRVTSFPV